MKYDLVLVSLVSLKCSLAGKGNSEILIKKMAFHHLMADCRIHLNFAMWTWTAARILFVYIGVRKLPTKVICD